MSKQGTIYLVGTGPGEVSLITAKGLALVQEAGAIVGDALSHAALLREANPEADIHDVGCRAGQNKMAQADINHLLIELARQGKTVVRLWPGDPFVYGRANQELAAVREAGLPVQVVPGVTSAIAAPAYAGVPVTAWEQGISFAVVTGLDSKNPAVSGPDWPALAQAVETIVVMMPVERLAEITAQLQAGGRPAETPALAVQHGSQPYQKQVSGTLASIADLVQTQGFEHLSVVVIGPVAGLAPELAWFEAGAAQPLLGKRVLVTRPAHQAGDFMADLRALGAEPVAFPTIEIKPVADTEPLDRAIRRLGDWRAGGGTTDQPYDWLVLTSANGVDAFWAGLARTGLDSRVLAGLQVAAIGPATAAAMQQRSITPDLVPAVYTAEGVLAAFAERGSVAGQRFLLARADIARKTLAEGLAAQGALVDEIPAYRTVPVSGESAPPFADIVTFTSSSTVQGYVNCLGERSPAEALQNSQVVCIGPITAGTARKLGLPVTAVAEEYTIAGLLHTLQTALPE